jgi:hypothetical protein
MLLDEIEFENPSHPSRSMPTDGGLQSRAGLGRSLDFAKVPQREKDEVLGAFAAHKNEVTAWSQPHLIVTSVTNLWQAAKVRRNEGLPHRLLPWKPSSGTLPNSSTTRGIRIAPSLQL